MYCILVMKNSFANYKLDDNLYLYYFCLHWRVVSKDIPAGKCNLHIWDMHGQIVTEFIQKQQEDW